MGQKRPSFLACGGGEAGGRVSMPGAEKARSAGGGGGTRLNHGNIEIIVAGGPIWRWRRLIRVLNVAFQVNGPRDK
jgi:hypothetical protein